MVITERKPFLPEGICQITNGPSKYDLQAAIFDGKTVQFSINAFQSPQTMDAEKRIRIIGEVFNVRLEIIGREDGSNESWIGRMRISTLDETKSEIRAFYYDTRKRTGTISERGKNWKITE